MRTRLNDMLRVSLTYTGTAIVLLGLVVATTPTAAYEDGYCNEGGDPSMPKGCYGWCWSPKICTIHPIQKVCACR